jgi:hypothetical protein
MRSFVTVSSCVLVSIGLTACAAPDGPVDEQESYVGEREPLVVDLLGRLRADALRGDGRIDEAEMKRLAAFVPDGSPEGRNAEAVRFLTNVLRDDARALTQGAETVAKSALEGRDRGPGLDTPQYRLVEKGAGTFVFDDDLFLLADGEVRGRPELVGHSRGYAAYRDGVLRFAHGSRVPVSRALTPDEATALRQQTPAAALDRAATARGLSLGTASYTYFAEKVHYRPGANTPYWEGLCHAWTTAALDDRLSVLVDVPGAPGKRGVWYMGQWMSRADLGNWTMGSYDAISISDAVTVDSFVRPENWVKGLIRHAMNGKGLRADLWNDTDKGASEVWNQPILSANVKVATVDDDAAARIVAYAAKDASRWERLPAAGAKVKLVTATARWAVETSDDHEEATGIRTSTWNVYAIVDETGKVARGYMAHALGAVPGALPTRTSDSLPDYFAFPTHSAIDAILNEKKHLVVDGAFQGKILKFFVGEVLARGIPAETREAFEAEALGAAPPSAEALAKRFPGVANAYSKEQWDRSFAPRLGDGKAFGARFVAP